MSTPSPVTVYWRPGCPYCIRLRAKLRRARVPTVEVNIWEDPAGAAFVRSVTGGDETVPTVRVGDETFVNPRPGRLVDTIRAIEPSLVGPDPESGGRPRRNVWGRRRVPPT